MGGAKNCPETPRQKMIGMMYLVLTAMLALNVSTDILNGFTMVDNSLHSSIAASETRNARLYQDFELALQKNPAKTQMRYDEAQRVKQKADSLYDYLQNFKYDIARLADGGSVDAKIAQGEDPTLHIQNNSDLDVAGEYAIVGGHGQELKDNVSAYCAFITGLINQKDSVLSGAIKATLATDKAYNAHDRQWVDWEIAVFDGMPIGASMAVLSKMQNDVRTTEGQIIQYLMDQTDAGDARFNRTQAYIIPASTNVIRGGKYSAKIILAAEDTTKRPDFYVDGVQINSHGLYEVNATSVGKKQYSGYISYEQNDEIVKLPFIGEYIVSEPAVTISNTELTIMYRGYENKFSVSVPGVPDEKVQVSVTNASVRKQGGLWLITPHDNAQNAVISVTAEMDGRKQSMGSKEYRVRKLPDPKVFLTVKDRPYGSGKITLSNLVNKSGELTASYGKDEVLNLPFKVTSFSLFAKGKWTDSRSNKFTNEQYELLNKCKPNDLVQIDEIKVIGPNGKPIPVDPVTFRVN